MHDDEHQRFRAYLYNVMSVRLADKPNAIVFGVRVAWAHPDVKPHGPDISVVFNLRRRINWETFDEKEEGTKPSLIIEIVCPWTRETDVVSKVKEYEMVGVPLYIIVDRFERDGVMMRQLVGYRLTPKGYEELSPNVHGWLWLEPVNVWIGLDGEDLVCYEKGKALPDYVTLVRAAKESQACAAEEAQARVAAENRAAEESQARAEEAQARVAAETRAADAEERAIEEAQARTDAEERIHQLEAELRRRTP